MKKAIALAGTALIAGVLAMQPTAANAACVNYAIWTEDGDTGEIKKWSTDGELLTTLTTTITAGDIAVSSDLTQILAFNNTDLEAFSATTGALESTHAVSGGEFTGGGAGAGVISGGKLITDSGYIDPIDSVEKVLLSSVDLTTYIATDWAYLEDADASVSAGMRGGDWQIAGDVLQLPDGDVLVVANNSTVYSDGVILLRVNKQTPTTITAVGGVAIADAVWGAARGGDDIFLATDAGRILKVASIPTSASLAPVDATEIVSGGGSFWGAAGSDDSTDGNAVCQEATLPNTGLDGIAGGIIASSIIAAGGIALVIRRRAAQA